jgi:hypothetical protein
MADTLDALANDLVKFWKNNPLESVRESWKNRKVDVSDVASGLKSLAASGELDLNLLELIGDVDPRIDLAIKAIRTAQSFASNLEIDGIFGRKTRARFKDFRSCNDKTTSDKEFPSGSFSAQLPGLGILFYHIDESLRSKEIDSISATEMIVDATHAWIFDKNGRRQLDLVMRLVEDPAEANVLITQENLGGPGGTLGIAHIGGRHVKQQLSLRFDENESWNEKKFRNTAIHELGHIFGLTHASGSGNIMNAFQNVDQQSPSHEDIMQMQQIWGDGSESISLS